MMMSMTNRVSFQLDWEGDSNTLWTHRLMNGGRMTVCHRMTSFGWPDEETGYRSPCGQFWLASGHCDVRDVLRDFASEDEMIAWVIENANNCTGGHQPKSAGIPYDRLMHWANWTPTKTVNAGAAP